MKELAIYLLEFTFISLLFYAVFKLIKSYSTPTFKRFFLLAWMVFSVTFPLISLDGYRYSVPHLEPLESPQITTISEVVNPGPNTDDFISSDNSLVEVHTLHSYEEREKEIYSITNLLIGIYLLIGGLFLARLLLGAYQVWKLKKSSVTVSHSGTEIHLVEKSGFAGASFFNWVFIGTDVEAKDLDLLIKHETTHRRLGHSYDVVLSHLYQVVFWFHPLSWVMKKEVSLNAELETDFKIAHGESMVQYGNLLLDLHQFQRPVLMNHFSAGHLKIRIKEMSNKVSQKKWVTALSCLLVLGTFATVSCGNLDGDELIMEEKLGEVKTITTRFTSHQSDTQQKTGKVVSIASFNPDGSLDDFVSKTTYPYDRDYEVKREFWDTPLKKNLFYIMDGLSMGVGEKNLLYGNDWPKAYYKHLDKMSKAEVSGEYHWEEKVSADNPEQPSEIRHQKQLKKEGGMNDKTKLIFSNPEERKFYEYDDGKVVSVFYSTIYEIPDLENLERDISEKTRANWEKKRKESGVKKLSSTYTYDGDLLTSIKQESLGSFSGVEYKFYYDNDVLSRTEHYIEGDLISTRYHYYKSGLKDRTEIFNRYNEPEYTIDYEYEFW